ncbi:MAG: hypothetical protein KAJ09_09575 [Deltaproteobacteria bacterium]|nr:hypothetical protein [Deltaproteobacteria bacterium]
MRAEALPVVRVKELGARTKEVIEKDHAFVTLSYNRYYDIFLEERESGMNNLEMSFSKCEVAKWR